jgi:hypothetical protein
LVRFEKPPPSSTPVSPDQGGSIFTPVSTTLDVPLLASSLRSPRSLPISSLTRPYQPCLKPPALFQFSPTSTTSSPRIYRGSIAFWHLHRVNRGPSGVMPREFTTLVLLPCLASTKPFCVSNLEPRGGMMEMVDGMRTWVSRGLHSSIATGPAHEEFASRIIAAGRFRSRRRNAGTVRCNADCDCSCSLLVLM